MQPFGAVEKIKESYQRYVETSFPLLDEGLRSEFRRLINQEHLLWQEPFVSLSRPFKAGGTLEDLVHDGMVGHGITNSSSVSRSPNWSFSRLYRHQRQAIERLTSLHHHPQNTIIATGTGSGKTEAFLIPIIDHCLRNPEKGVQAVLVYPMNALVNDQLKRLRDLLRGTGVTFGRYTGDTRATLDSRSGYGQVSIEDDIPAEERYTRAAIRQDPPQILLTNYTMLEYLLVRKQDRQMFRITQPHYLVLDEIHTYVGILGSEVACLIRRFKEHAGLMPGRLCCIGTSATLISPTSDDSFSIDTNPYDDLLVFATTLFGEDFPDGKASIVREDYEEIPVPSEPICLGPTPNLSEDFFKKIDMEQEDDVRRLAERLHIHIAQDVQGEEFFRTLYDELEQRPIFTKFEEKLKEPRSLNTLVEWLKQQEERVDVCEEDLRREVAAVLLLGSVAYRHNVETGEDEPRYRPKVHLSVRSLTPLTMTLNSTNGTGRLLSEGETEYKEHKLNRTTSPRAASPGQPKDDTVRPALPLAVCRSCGASYLKGYYERDEDELLASMNSAKQSGGRRRSRKTESAVAKQLPERLKLMANQPYNRLFQEMYVHLAPVNENIASEFAEAEDVADGEDIGLAEGIKVSRWYLVCPHCLVAQGKDTVSSPSDFQHDIPGCPGKQEVLPTFFGFGKAVMCPRCKAQGHGVRDIITLMRSGAAASVSILTESLLPTLKADQDGSIGEKKVLIFADSRQDTAHQAGYLRDRHQTFTQRQLAYKTIEWHEQHVGMPIPLDSLAQEVYKYSKHEWNSEADALNLLALDIPRSGEPIIGLRSADEAITQHDRKRARERLEWDLYVEFTERADVRNSLEREGLVTVRYAELEKVARESVGQFAKFGFTERETEITFLAHLLQVIMDYMRRQKAVVYAPFRDFLSAGSDAVQDGIARPTKYNRTPNGFDAEKKEYSGAYKVFSWYSKSRDGRSQTAIQNAVSRMLDIQVKIPDVITMCIDTAIKLLESKGYIRKVRIGQQTGGSANLVRDAYQLVPQKLEVTIGGQRFRCSRCGDIRSYQVVSWSTHSDTTPETICANYRCKGKTKPYDVREQNFYVQFYRGKPERLYTMEHSGQLTNEERVEIEKGFKDGKINALVCTQTLELGVDIGDLLAIILRNMPPTPSNYAQRSGRPGRRRKIALILSHAGQGPHDTYFFHHLEDMIKGAIRPPVFLMNNQVVITRHLNSLIMEKLDVQLPGRWRKEEDEQGPFDDDDLLDQRGELVSEEGELQVARIDEFRNEIRRRRAAIVGAVKGAFARERMPGNEALPWLNSAYIEERCDRFADELQVGLEHWCIRYREIYRELARMNRKVLLSRMEERRQVQLRDALRTLLRNKDYRPLSYLTKVGFLPRYGFPGNVVTVYDDKERQVSQVASLGVTEYALGNVVYVAGRKIQVNRVHFKGGSKEDPLRNAHPYKHCPNCTYTTEQPTAQECPYCHELLKSSQQIEYEMAHGWGNEVITQNDEYRSYQDYDLGTYLKDEVKENDEQQDNSPETRDIGRWKVRYSRLREITIFNRGKIDPKTGQIVRFTVCLECGAWIRPRTLNEEAAERAGFRTTGSDHLYSCSVRTDVESPYVQRVDLKVQLHGDVVEISLPCDMPAGEDFIKWVETLQQALKLGLQLELFVQPGEIQSFVATYKQDGYERKTLVLYDRMPGGTGYLRRFYDYLPQIARRVLDHLQRERCETACYSCLKEFWNQRLHGLLDKRLVYSVLEELALAEVSRP